MKLFLLPDLGEGLAEAEIHQWYVKPGEYVELDQPLVSMETAKAVIDVPSPFAGTVNQLFGGPGDIINTGKPLVGFADDSADDAGTVVGDIITGNTTITDTGAGIQTVQPARETAIKALPAVRALARQLDIDLENIKGSGHLGQITADDVKKAYHGHTSAPPAPDADFTPLHGVRRSMAQCMTQSHQQVAPVTIMDDADIEHWPDNADITVRTLRALQYACSKEPSLNVWFDGYKFTEVQHPFINVGLAMDSAAGLFTPVLKNIAEQSDEALRAQIEQLKVEVAERRITPKAMQGATIMLSNVGIFSARYATPIIVPPTVAIIAMGKIRPAALVVNGAVKARRVLPLSLTFDHRIITGGEATRFLAAIIETLQGEEEPVETQE